MDFENWPSLDTSTWPIGSPESIREQSEKQKESYKKAQAQLQKTKKDESKAQKDNAHLFDILLRFIQNPYYSELIPVVTELLALRLPSRYILALTALVYPESALHMLTSLERRESIHILLAIHRHDEMIDFDDAHIDPSIRAWMTEWINAFHLYMTVDESSVISLSILRDHIHGKTYISIVTSFSIFLRFFFQSRNIRLSEKKSESYAQFILSEIIELIDEQIRLADPDLARPIVAPDFFWLSPNDR
jgi:hypothetical protein